MILALLAVLTAPGSSSSPPTALVRVDDPPIRITLNSGGYYQRGDRAKRRGALVHETDPKVRLLLGGRRDVTRRADARGD